MRRGPTVTHADDRAVSDVIAFIIVFSIIITSVGIVYVVGFDGIEEYSSNELSKNAEQGMDALAQHLNDVHETAVPERSGEIFLRGETLSITEGTTVQVEAGGSVIHERQLGALTYEIGDGTISYEGGTIVRQEDENSVMLTDPTLVCSDRGDTTVAMVSLVTVADSNGSVSTDGLVEVDAVVSNRSLDRYDVSGGVTLDFTGDTPNHTQAWTQHVESAWGSSGCDADVVYVRTTDVDISLDLPV